MAAMDAQVAHGLGSRGGRGAHPAAAQDGVARVRGTGHLTRVSGDVPPRSDDAPPGSGSPPRVDAAASPAADELDCLTCGACCRTGSDGRILVPPEDLVRWRRIGRPDLVAATQPGHFGLRAFATRRDGACVHLGTPGAPNACAIYPDRGTTCREFEKGSWQCREFRRDFGIEPPRSPGRYRAGGSDGEAGR